MQNLYPEGRTEESNSRSINVGRAGAQQPVRRPRWPVALGAGAGTRCAAHNRALALPAMNHLASAGWSWSSDGANDALLGGKQRRGSVNEEQNLAPRERTMGIIPGAASMLNSVIGTGILALPVAFSRVGYGLGIVLLVVCCILAAVSLVIIGICSTEVGCAAGSSPRFSRSLARSLALSHTDTYTGGSASVPVLTHLLHSRRATSYGTMIERALGPRWGKLSSLIVALHMYGACLAYSLVIATNMTDLLNDQGWVGANEPIIPGQTGDNWWTFDNRRFWVVAPAVGVVLPLILLPNYSALRFASVLATSSMVYLTAVIAVLGFIGANRDGLPLWRGEADSRISSPTLPPAICCEQDDVTEDGVCTEAVEGALYPAAVPWGQPDAVILDTDIFSSFSTFLFAFLSHSMSPQVVAEFKEPSTPRLAQVRFQPSRFLMQPVFKPQRDHMISNHKLLAVLFQMMSLVACTCGMIYFFVGLMGYLQFSNCVCSNISVSFGPNGWVAVGQYVHHCTPLCLL